MTQLNVKCLVPLPYASMEPRWLQLIPQSGSVLIYNSSQADIYSLDPEGSTLSHRTDLKATLADRYKPRQVKLCDPAGSQLLVTGADRKCHLVDTATGQALASTLGEHDFFAVELHDRFAYLIDYQQELLVRYNWPALRNACALSLIRKTDSAMCTVLDSLQPWHLAMAGGHLLVTKCYGGPAFSEAHAAVCLNAQQRLWTGALAKPEKPPPPLPPRKSRRMTTPVGAVGQKSTTAPDAGDAAADAQAISRCYGKYWLPGDRYLACDSGSSDSSRRQLFLSSAAEGAIYVYGLSSSSIGRGPPSPSAASASTASFQEPDSGGGGGGGALCLSTALVGLLPDDGQRGRRRPRLQPGSLAVDPARRLLLALVGDSHAGVNYLMACDIGC